MGTDHVRRRQGSEAYLAVEGSNVSGGAVLGGRRALDVVKVPQSWALVEECSGSRTRRVRMQGNEESRGG